MRYTYMKSDVGFLRKKREKLSVWLVCLLAIPFFSCSGDSEEPYTDSMPSSPTTLYMIKGEVVDAENTARGLDGIQVKIVVDKPHAFVDTLYTAKGGMFDWEASLSTFGKELELNVVATDTSGVYGFKEAPVFFRKNENPDNDSQFLEEMKKEIQIKLSKKKTN